jgi:hypothetical protein
MKRIILLIFCCLLLPIISLAARPKLNKNAVQLNGDMQYKLVHYNKYHEIQIDEDPPLFPVNYEVDLGDLKLKTPQDLWQFEQGFIVVTPAQLAAVVPETFPNATGQTWADYTSVIACGTYSLLILDRGGFDQTGTCRKNPPTQAELALYISTFTVDYIIPKQQGLDLIATGVCGTPIEP